MLITLTDGSQDIITKLVMTETKTKKIKLSENVTRKQTKLFQLVAVGNKKN